MEDEMSVALALLLALLAQQRVRIVDSTGDTPGAVTPPTIVSYTDPFYTRRARDNKIEGTVTVEGVFDAKGKMRFPRIVKELGYGLDENALAATGSWTFCPALRDKTPVEVVAQIDIEFTLAALPPSEFDDVKYAGVPGMSSPRVVRRIEPKYTDAARSARIGGTVLLQTIIGVDGTARVLKIVRPLPEGLTESAIAALEQWTFTPATLREKKIPVSLLVGVNFNLEGNVNRIDQACPSPGQGR